MKLKLLLATTIAVTLSGCMTPKTAPPIDVAMIPNDCRNKDLIVNWLTEQAMVVRQPLESEIDYERHRRQIRAKIWHFRYHCQPV